MFLQQLNHSYETGIRTILDKCSPSDQRLCSQNTCDITSSVKNFIASSDFMLANK